MNNSQNVSNVVQRLTVGTSFQKHEKINGTSGQGSVAAAYADLVRVFGEPHGNGDGYKIDAEWAFKFSDGTVATIYNWKDGRNYEGENGLDVVDITNWHVGGNSKLAVQRVREHLGA